MRLKKKFGSLVAAFILMTAGSIVLIDLYLYIALDEATISDILSSYSVFRAHPLLISFFGMIVGGLMVHFLGFVPKGNWIKGHHLCENCRRELD